MNSPENGLGAALDSDCFRDGIVVVVTAAVDAAVDVVANSNGESRSNRLDLFEDVKESKFPFEKKKQNLT